MPSKYLTFDEVVATTKAVAQERPDHIQQVCQYVQPQMYPATSPDGTKEPGCLVGQVLFRLGWTIEELLALDVADTDQSITNVSSLFEAEYLEGDDAAMEFLQTAQSYQDGGKEWLPSFEAALTETVPAV